MENLSEKQYITERVEEQIKWYDDKSKKAQKYYKRLTYVILVSAAIIPLATNLLVNSIWTKLFISFLGIATTLSQGIINLNDYNQNWIEYRTVCETLKKEKYMYLTQAGVYSDNEESFAFFAERVESIISQENVNWANIKKEKKEND